VVVGSGVAGLTVALAAAPRPVLLLSRARNGGDTATALAQGGIAAALAAGDSAVAHAEDTLAAGGGCNDRAAVAALTGGAGEAIGWLQSLGVRFDSDVHGIHLAREGGHRRARVLHLGGDASGHHLLQALVAAGSRAGHITSRTGVEVESLLLHGDTVAGVGVRDPSGQWQGVEASAVVLATGGIGGLFAATSNPMSAQGAGLALGQVVGATMRDLELVQFHPTALATTQVAGASLPLLTEALRGAGAVLRDNQGRAFMQGEHPLADLAPRDVVARRIWQLQEQGNDIFLDATTIEADWAAHFPTVLASCLAAGIDPRAQPIPITPAAHFHMGGVATDIDGATSLPGLYAVGEVACNGVHGGNRLASNSLLEALVFGRRLGRHFADACLPKRPAGPPRWYARSPQAAAGDLARLRQWLWQGLGPVRNAAGMQLAIERIHARPTLLRSWQGRLALALLDAALHQHNNRGAHFRDDAIAEATSMPGDPVASC
jgi:L-aspartate oxidase